MVYRRGEKHTEDKIGRIRGKMLVEAASIWQKEIFLACFTVF